MRQRLISAAVLVPVVVLIYLAGEPWLSIGIALLAVLAAYETSRLLTLAGFPSPAWLSSVGACAAVIAVQIVVAGTGALLSAYVTGFVATVAFVAGVVALVSDRATNHQEWLGAAIGILYPALLAFMLALLFVPSPKSPGAPLVGNLDFGRLLLLVLVLTVWALDSFAYLVGRAYPRGRMAPRISPKKTWSGAIGGTIAAVIVCAIVSALVGVGLVVGLVLGVVIAVSAQAGDLTESLLKRRAGVKDSGTLIPGHGGILDRVDSFMFAAPAMFVTLSVVQYLGIWMPA
ncbi:MAG: phosphatidate cytidylyltransferase [Candidatus Limnocylindrales bacterium]